MAALLAQRIADCDRLEAGQEAEGQGLRVRVWRGLFLSASYVYQNARLVMRESTGPNQSINGFSVLYQNHLALAGIGWAF